MSDTASVLGATELPGCGLLALHEEQQVLTPEILLGVVNVDDVRKRDLDPVPHSGRRLSVVVADEGLGLAEGLDCHVALEIAALGPRMNENHAEVPVSTRIILRALLQAHKAAGPGGLELVRSGLGGGSGGVRHSPHLLNESLALGLKLLRNVRLEAGRRGRGSGADLVAIDVALLLHLQCEIGRLCGR